MILRTPQTIQEFTNKKWWDTETWTQLFARQIANHPDRIAVVDPINRAEFTDGAARRLTYAEFGDYCAQLATTLLDQGIAQDDIVVAQLPNTVELVALFFAASHIGAIVSPLPVQFREYEIEQTVNHLNAKAFITTTRIGKHNHAEMILKLRAKLPSLGKIFAFGENVPDGVIGLDALMAHEQDASALEKYRANHSFDANDVITICWTSGTEGKPKGVPRSYNDWYVPGRAAAQSCRKNFETRVGRKGERLIDKSIKIRRVCHSERSEESLPSKTEILRPSE